MAQKYLDQLYFHGAMKLQERVLSLRRLAHACPSKGKANSVFALPMNR